MKKITRWIKVGAVFLDQDNVHSVLRSGRGTLVERISGEAIEIDMPYDKVSELLKPGKG